MAICAIVHPYMAEPSATPVVAQDGAKQNVFHEHRGTKYFDPPRGPQPHVLVDDPTERKHPFSSWQQFAQLDFVESYQSDPDFVGFFVRKRGGRGVRALFKDGRIMDVGMAESSAGLENLPTREELESQRVS